MWSLSYFSSVAIIFIFYECTAERTRIINAFHVFSVYQFLMVYRLRVEKPLGGWAPFNFEGTKWKEELLTPAVAKNCCSQIARTQLFAHVFEYRIYVVKDRTSNTRSISVHFLISIHTWQLKGNISICLQTW